MTAGSIRRAAVVRVWPALVLLASAACIEGTQPVNPPPVEVELTSDRSAVAPGQDLVMLLVATPKGGRSIRYAKLTLSGSYSAKDSIGGSGTQPVTIEQTYTIPATTPRGQILVTGVAVTTDGSTARVDGTITVSP